VENHPDQGDFSLSKTPICLKEKTAGAPAVDE
jgi:hypothetical protein